MSGRKMKIVFQGREVEAEVIDANQSTERWSEYLLDDGTILRVKPVVTNIYRVEGAHNAQGDPVYSVNFTTVVSADAPENLKNKPTA